jgi:hypothetical protein
MQTSGFKSSKVIPLALKAIKLSFQIMQLATNWGYQILWPLSQAAASKQPNAFTFVLPLSE